MPWAKLTKISPKWNVLNSCWVLWEKGNSLLAPLFCLLFWPLIVSSLNKNTIACLALKRSETGHWSAPMLLPSCAFDSLLDWTALSTSLFVNRETATLSLLDWTKTNLCALLFLRYLFISFFLAFSVFYVLLSVFGTKTNLCLHWVLLCLLYLLLYVSIWFYQFFICFYQFFLCVSFSLLLVSICFCDEKAFVCIAPCCVCFICFYMFLSGFICYLFVSICFYVFFWDEIKPLFALRPASAVSSFQELSSQDFPSQSPEIKFPINFFSLFG